MFAGADDGQFKRKQMYVVINEQQTEILWSEYKHTVLHMLHGWLQADLAVVYCRLSFLIITRLPDFLNWSTIYYDVWHT